MKRQIFGSIGLIGITLFLLLSGCSPGMSDKHETPVSFTATISLTASASAPATRTPVITPYSPTVTPRFSGNGLLMFSDVQHLYEIEASSGNTQLITREGEYLSPTWTLSGFVYFTDGAQIFRIIPGSSEPKQTIVGSGYVGNFAVSLAGDHLAYASSEGVTFLEFNKVGEVVDKVVLIRNLPAESLAWSNDGKRLAFLEWPDNEEGNDLAAYGSLYLVDADGQNLKHVSSDGLRISTRFPAWSPDDRTIAIPMKDQNGTNLYVINVGNNYEIRPLTKAAGVASYPLWSPDGTRILFIQDRQLFIIAADGSSLQIVADELAAVGRGYQAAWSPDGNYIAYVGQQGNLQVLNIVPSVGGYRINLNANNKFYHIDSLSWVNAH